MSFQRNIKSNQAGFSFVIISILLVVVFAVCGVIGWKVYKNTNSNDKDNVQTRQSFEGDIIADTESSTGGLCSYSASIIGGESVCLDYDNFDKIIINSGIRDEQRKLTKKLEGDDYIVGSISSAVPDRVRLHAKGYIVTESHSPSTPEPMYEDVRVLYIDKATSFKLVEE